jgi:hypothetical protein
MQQRKFCLSYNKYGGNFPDIEEGFYAENTESVGEKNAEMKLLR